MSDPEQPRRDSVAHRVATRFHAGEPTAVAWGLELEDAREGYARTAMVVRPDMLNGHGICHGAMIFALADSTFAYACNSRNLATVAQHASISFLSAVKLGERLVCEGVERSLQGRSGVYDMTVRSGERTVAIFQGLSRSLGGPAIAEET